MAVSSTRRLVVRVDGVSHEIARVELVDARGVSLQPPPPVDPGGNTARVVLLCAPDLEGFRSGDIVIYDRFVWVAPDTIMNVPDGTGIDCMTCLVRRSRA